MAPSVAIVLEKCILNADNQILGNLENVDAFAYVEQFEKKGMYFVTSDYSNSISEVGPKIFLVDVLEEGERERYSISHLKHGEIKHGENKDNLKKGLLKLSVVAVVLTSDGILDGYTECGLENLDFIKAIGAKNGSVVLWNKAHDPKMRHLFEKYKTADKEIDYVMEEDEINLQSQRSRIQPQQTISQPQIRQERRAIPPAVIRSVVITTILAGAIYLSWKYFPTDLLAKINPFGNKNPITITTDKLPEGVIPMTGIDCHINTENGKGAYARTEPNSDPINVIADAGISEGKEVAVRGLKDNYNLIDGNAVEYYKERKPEDKYEEVYVTEEIVVCKEVVKPKEQK